MPLCRHLRADDDVDLAIGDGTDKAFGASGRGHRVAGKNGEAGVGESLQHLFGQPLDTGTAGLHAVFLATFDAVPARTCLMAAIMAFQAPGKPVDHHPAVTVRAGDLGSAGAAQRQGRIATAIQEQQRLLARLEPLGDGLDKGRRQPASALRRCPAKIDRADIGQHRPTDPSRQHGMTVTRRITSHAGIDP